LVVGQLKLVDHPLKPQIQRLCGEMRSPVAEAYDAALTLVPTAQPTTMTPTQSILGTRTPPLGSTIDHSIRRLTG